MAEYAKIYKKIWNNNKYRLLSDDAKYLWLYILSSPHSSLTGIYTLTKLYIQSDLGWQAKRLAKAFGILLAKGYIKYDDKNSVIFIPSWFEHNSFLSKNQLIRANLELTELPQTYLFQELKAIVEALPDAIPFVKGLGIPLGIPLGKGYSYTNSLTPTPTLTPTLSSTSTPTVTNSSVRAHKKFIEFWCSEYMNRTNTKYMFSGGKDGKIVSELLKAYEYDMLVEMTIAFFETTDSWVVDKGFTIGIFKSQINQIAQKLREPSFLKDLSATGRHNYGVISDWLTDSKHKNMEVKEDD